MLNNPYVPGDPYSYDLKWLVAKVKEILAQLGTLDEAIEAKIFEGFLEHSVVQFKTVPEMLAADITDGSIVLTLGYHEAGDQGGLFYLVKDFNPSQCALDYFLTLDNNKQIAIPVIVTPYVTPEMFGAYGDGTTDDTNAFIYALAQSKQVKCCSDSYRVSGLTLTNGQSLIGKEERPAATSLKCTNGIVLEGNRNSLKYLEIRGDNPRESATGHGVHIKGYDAQSAYMNVLEGVEILQYEHGIYAEGLIWNTEFRDMRIQFCKTGITCETEGSNFVMENVLFSGNITRNVKLMHTHATFDYCNFGFSVANDNIHMSQNVDAAFRSCRFECDKYIEDSGALIYLTGKHASFENCLFMLTMGPNNYVMQTLSGVEGVEIKNCRVIPVTIGSNADQHYGFFEKSTSDKAARFGAIRVIGSPTVEGQLDPNNANRVTYTSFPFFFFDSVGVIQSYQQGYLYTQYLYPGFMAYIQSTTKFVFYNGTSLVDL